VDLPVLPDSLTERQRECVEAYYEFDGSEYITAKHLGVDVKSLRSSLWLAHKKGLVVTPDNYSPAAPTGWECFYSTVQHNGDGDVVQQWDRVKPTVGSTEDFAKFVSQRVPISDLEVPKKKKGNKNYMLQWPVFDPHHGMLAWAEESGADYDHKISRHLQVSAGKILFQSFGRVKKAVLIFGGDNGAADNRSGITEKSGHVLDTDTRFGKMVWCVYETCVSCIDIAVKFADEVEVFVLSGNHDWHSAIHLTIQLSAHYRNIPRVKVNISPEKHRFFQWGSTVFMATHGDTPDKRIASFALQQVLKRGFARNQDIERVRVVMGHLHKRGRKTPDMLSEEDGVVIERFPTLAAQEAYSVEGGYTSIRATEANLWHHQHGRHGGREITIGEILEKFPL